MSPFEQDSYVHRADTEPLIGATIDHCFRAVVARFGPREAVVSVPQSRRKSYDELDAAVERLARGLLALEVQRGDRVGVWSTDNLEWLVLQLATARVGAVLVNVNPAYRISELRHAMNKARIQVLFTIPSFHSSDYAGMLLQLCPEARTRSAAEFACEALPDLRHLVVWDPQAPAETASPAPGFLTWQQVDARGAHIGAAAVTERAASLDSDDPINIQFTSGTTGHPKAVELSHHNLVNNAWFTGSALGLSAADRLCVPVPFYHCFGMVVSNLVCLLRGATLVIPAPHFEAGATLAAIQDERCTVIHGVPTMFIAELERPDRAEYDLSSLRTGIMAGAPCPPEVLRRVIEEMGCKEILVGYGQTEASPVTHLTRADDSFELRLTTVGTNLPHTEAKVIDVAGGATLPCGEQGEVCVRGYHVMRGYFEDPEATRRAIDPGGWLHTGDLGVIDAAGYLRITGRLKDMIIRGGENIYPAEIEELYYTHPQVAEVAVFGVPDPTMGEEVGAWIRLRDGADTGIDELREFARRSLAHYKTPRYVWIVDEFPMTVTGKIQKFRIREIVATGDLPG